MPLTERETRGDSSQADQECGLKYVRFEVSLRYPRDYNMKVLPRLKKKKFNVFQENKVTSTDD